MLQRDVIEAMRLASVYAQARVRRAFAMTGRASGAETVASTAKKVDAAERELREFLEAIEMQSTTVTSREGVES